MQFHLLFSSFETVWCWCCCWWLWCVYNFKNTNWKKGYSIDQAQIFFIPFDWSNFSLFFNTLKQSEMCIIHTQAQMLFTLMYSTFTIKSWKSICWIFSFVFIAMHIENGCWFSYPFFLRLSLSRSYYIFKYLLICSSTPSRRKKKHQTKANPSNISVYYSANDELILDWCNGNNDSINIYNTIKEKT